MTSEDRRLDGWKAIAAHFGRDRTTVARWARERGLPIHQLPGGKQKTVFAFERELVEWAQRNSTAELFDIPLPQSPQGSFDAEPDGAVTGKYRSPALYAGLAALALAGLFAWGLWHDRSQSEALPEDPVVARDFVAARDAWGHRTPKDLGASIRLYTSVIERDPNYAPARAGLAESWLIYREYGEVNDAEAFGKARSAAQKALDLDPDLASAHRAQGFIEYWWDNDPEAALKSFREALRLDGEDGQTYFWLANILSDLGEDAMAERYYTKAMLVMPGSQPIAVEHAWSRWQAGNDREALALLLDLKRTYPQDATISSCLSWVYLGMGDIRGFTRELGDFARLRSDPGAAALAEKMTGALNNDPARAPDILIADARGELAEGGRRIRQTPAFYASATGRRNELVSLMKEAVVLGERWNSRPVTRRIESAWKNDPEVTGLLGQLVFPPPRVALP